MIKLTPTKRTFVACLLFITSRSSQVGTMEALNKKLTGDDTEFSEQYFVDCTFTYSGCAGGTANEGYKLTLMRQYMMSAQDWPYTADCMF